MAATIVLAGCSADPTNAPPAGPTSTFPNVLAGVQLWVNQSSSAAVTAAAWRQTRAADAAQMDKIAAGSVAQWFGSWNTDVQSDVAAATTNIANAGALPVFVTYNIPQHDCGALSGDNATAAAAYKSWITAFANGIGSRRAAVILEPDALAEMDCLDLPSQQQRLDLLTFAVQTFASHGSIAIYIDAGNPGWRSASVMASRLGNAGIANAQGFSLNVANFLLTSDNVTYGTEISSLVGGKHFIIDTGRNGAGPAADGQLCTPAGRALGNRPTTATGNSLVDAYLWVKAPGESDGPCNGAPSWGVWMPEYALGLAQRAAY